MRRSLLLALLGLIACLAIGLGPAMIGEDPGQAFSSVGSLTTAHPDSGRNTDATDAPCILRADCAGGLGLVTVALLPLVVMTAATVLPSPAPAHRVRHRPTRLRDRLVAERLLRPPQA